MLKLNKELIRSLTDDNNLIGEGKNRAAYRINNKIYKKTFSRYDSMLNMIEYNLYMNNSELPFLCEVIDISLDGRIVEVEECIPIDEFLEELDINMHTIDLYDENIDLVIDRYPMLKQFMDWDWNMFYRFVEDNNLNKKEILSSFNWGISKARKQLVCLDYADIEEVNSVKVA